MSIRLYNGETAELRVNGEVIPIEFLTVSDSEPEREEDYEFLPPPDVVSAQRKFSKADLRRSPAAVLNDDGDMLPANLAIWAQWLAAAGDTRKIAKTELRGGVSVSTAFVGLNRSRMDGSAPADWFETMVFGAESEWVEYSEALEEAKQTHKRVVKRFARIERNEKREKQNRTASRGR